MNGTPNGRFTRCCQSMALFSLSTSVPSTRANKIQNPAKLIKTMSRTLKQLGALLVVFASAASMQAATVNFDFTGNAGDGVGTNTRNFNSSPAGISVAVTGWAFNGTTFIQGSVGQYSGGLGIRNTPDDDSHTVDNSGYIDYMLFHFSQAIDINSVSFGYVEGDSDFKYWIGNTGTIATLTGSGGFSVFGGSSPSLFNINAGNLTGTWIAIAAEPAAGDRDDHFKISAMNVSTKVPDSASTIMLMSLGLAGLVALRRRAC